MSKQIKIIAHRGYSSRYPDNSLRGFEQAWKLGADMIETDIRFGPDETLVCSHDETDEKVLTLDAALAFAKGKIELLLDLKEDTPRFHLKLAQALTGHDMEDAVVIGVRSLDQARSIRSLLPQSRQLGFLKDPAEFPEFYKIGGSIGRLWEGEWNEANMKLAKSGEHPVFVMAGFYPKETKGIGDITPDRLRQVMAWDVQGILVNDPALALRVRNEFSPRAPAPAPSGR